jgi:anti-sigma factor ChrR (cupin superfamily)
MQRAMHDSINGDLSQRVTVDTSTLSWTPSPSGTVWRKRLHLVGPAESGQVTSVVRYEADSRFPAHDHPEGEEILVLEGVFSDEHGDWPAGTYLLNPEGFRHAPFSRNGCTLFVKLRQFPGVGRRHVVANTTAMPWLRGSDGRAIKPLYSQTGYSDVMRLEQWPPGWTGESAYSPGAEFFVLEGSFADEHGTYRADAWLRLPAGAQHRPRTDEGCMLYIKEGGFAYLRRG